MSNDTGHDEAETPATDETRPPKRLSRRGFLRAGAATSIATATAYTVILPGARDTEAADTTTIPVSEVQLAQAQPMAMPGNVLEGYTFFNPLMVDVVTAAAERIIPRDANGPGATDAGVVYFIDRQLSSEYGMTGKRFSAGPFVAGTPTQGDQLGSTMRERYRLGVDGMQAYAQKQYQKDFKALSPDQQDQVLRDMEAGAATGFSGITGQQFFQLLLAHVKAGFFADPIYGGNRDLVGWKMIGYPGAQIVYQDWIGRYGQKFTGPYMSLADHQEALHTGTGTPAAAAPATGTAPAATATGTIAAATASGTVAAPTASAPSATVAGQSAAGGTTVNVIEKDFAFAFDKSSVPPGTVTFAITNQGPSPHNLAFTSINKVSETINAGQTTKFTVDFQAGAYPFICNIPGHEQLGMKGTLTVK
ncbi:MAG: gluconate 2-dehydrogenase subunit 3 family protein [Thermomicrobiales bacterium]